MQRWKKWIKRHIKNESVGTFLFDSSSKCKTEDGSLSSLQKGEKTDMTDLQDKIAIVTGANSGMGMATVEALSDKGATVIMLCRSEERGRAALAELSKVQGRKLDLMLCDLGDFASITGMLKPFFLTPAEGAATAIYLATDESVGHVSGGCFYKCHIAKSSKRSKSRKAARRLFAISEEMVQVGRGHQ